MSEQRLLIHSPNNPFDLFKNWFERASKKEPNDSNAMNLSTISNKNKPSSRIVLLKSFDKRGFVFYTNFKSKKGISIKSNPYVALNFYWKSLNRQIRIEGKATKITDAEADNYFNSRPINSKIGAWASNQSNKLINRKELNDKIRFFQNKYKHQPIPRPTYWSGYRVAPKLIEFWQEMPFRLHDRLEYVKVKNVWKKRKLFP